MLPRLTQAVVVLCLVAALCAQPVAPTEASFTGKWSTTFGPMHLEQDGKQLTGRYSYSDIELHGTITDGELSITHSSGRASFRLTADRKLLLGSYQSPNGQRGFWGGYRIAATEAPHQPGKLTTGQTKSWLNYHLRVPKDYRKSRRYPALALLHGPDTTARDYIQTIAAQWPELAEHYILVGLDGEHLSRHAKAGHLAYNYSYRNFSGPMLGHASRYRQSPALVAEALEQLGRELQVRRWFLGGHSDGGALTYAVCMFYPDQVAGVFPMSCDLLAQCHPKHFKAAYLRSKQRRVAIAVVHGENDQVVPYRSGQDCFRAMVDGGFPKLHLFRHPSAAHHFAQLPVAEAIAWLESLNASDPSTLLSFAEAQIAASQYRDASAALARLQQLSAPRGLSARAEAARHHLEDLARAQGQQLQHAISEDLNGDWIEGFQRFRQQFAFTSPAKPVMAAFANLRQRHQGPAAQLVSDALRATDRAQRDAKYRELVRKYYASTWYETAKRRLAKSP